MSKKEKQLRTLVIQKAARIMHEEGVSQYLDAKKIASKRLFGKQLKNLPSNGEISDELYRISQFQRADECEQQLYLMRMCAIEVMQQLQPFSPRLIGSVSTGKIRETSDIDIHVFVDDIADLNNFLDKLSWDYETDQVSIRQNGKLTEYTHIYIQLNYPIELSVYPQNEIRVNSRSSTDGKTIKRLSLSKLKQLINNEHWEIHLKNQMQ